MFPAIYAASPLSSRKIAWVSGATKGWRVACTRGRRRNLQDDQRWEHGRIVAKSGRRKARAKKGWCAAKLSHRKSLQPSVHIYPARYPCGPHDPIKPLYTPNHYVDSPSLSDRWSDTSITEQRRLGGTFQRPGTYRSNTVPSGRARSMGSRAHRNHLSSTRRWPTLRYRRNYIDFDQCQIQC